MKLRKIMKRVLKGCLGLLLLCGIGALLSGCSLDKKSVKLHTKEEVEKDLNERYGDAEFVSMEENKEKHHRIFTFRDTKYGRSEERL